jgi:hypothetical protein
VRLDFSLFYPFTFLDSREAGGIYLCDHPKRDDGEALDPTCLRSRHLNSCGSNLVGLVRWDQWRAEYGERVALQWQLSLA